MVVDDRQTFMPPNWEPLAFDRDEEDWTWRLLDRQGRYLRDLEGVESGSLELNVNDEIRGGGSFSWSGPAEEMPVWRDVRVQPVYRARLMDGTRLEWVQGEFLCSSPSTSHQGNVIASASVSLYDRTLLLLRPKLTKMLALPAGTVVVTAIRSLLDSNGISRHAIPDSTKTLRTALAWDIGTSILRVVNDLLLAIGHYGIWADSAGVLRSAPANGAVAVGAAAAMPCCLAIRGATFSA